MFAEQIESNSRNKLYFTLQRNLVRDQLQENIARITWPYQKFNTQTCAKTLLKKLKKMFYGGKIFKVNSINFCHKNVVRGNAVQICSDFPAKRLSIFLKNFS